MVIRKDDYDPGRRNIKSEKTFAVTNFDKKDVSRVSEDNESVLNNIKKNMLESPKINTKADTMGIRDNDGERMEREIAKRSGLNQDSIPSNNGSGEDFLGLHDDDGERMDKEMEKRNKRNSQDNPSSVDSEDSKNLVSLGKDNEEPRTEAVAEDKKAERKIDDEIKKMQDENAKKMKEFFPDEKKSDDPHPELVSDPEIAAFGPNNGVVGGEGVSAEKDKNAEQPEKAVAQERDKEDPSVENGEIDELAKALNDARKKYVLKQNQFNEKSSLLRKIIGMGKGPGLGEFNTEFNEAKGAYEESLRSYRDARMKSAKGAEDMKGLLEYFSKDEFLKVAETRDQIMVENRNWPGIAKKGYMGMLNGYRDLSWKKKLMIGAALTGVGIASGAWAGAGAAMGVMVARRAFSMSVASVGFSRMFEGYAEREEDFVNKQNVESNLKKFTKEGGEIDMEGLSKYLDGRIAGINDEINSNDRAKKWRTYAAVAAGVGVSFLGSYVGGEIAQKLGGSGMIQGIINPENTDNGIIKGMSNETPDLSEKPSIAPNSDKIPGVGINEMSQESSGLSSKASEIGYQGGKSVWGEAENQLGARMKDAFNNLGSGDAKLAEALQTHNIDRLKDVIVADPEKYGLAAGTNFNKMSVDDLKGIDWDKAFTDVFGASKLTENLSPEQVNSIVGNNEALREALKAKGIVFESNPNIAQEFKEGWTPSQQNFVERNDGFTVSEAAHEVAGGNDYEKFLEESRGEIQKVITERQAIYDKYPRFISIKDFDGEMFKLQKEIDAGQWAAVDGADVGSSVQDNIKELNRLKELKEAYGKAYFNTFNAFVDAKNIAPGSLNMNAKEYIAQHGQDKMVKIFNSLKATMTPEQVKELKLDPRGNETTIHWAKRIVDVSMKNLGKK